MFQLSEFCRICLSKTNKLVSFKSEEEDHLRINEKLKFINPTLIPLDDQFPEWVCIFCRKQINEAYCLLEKALDSYNVLDKLIRYIKITGKTNLSVNLEGDIKDLLERISGIKQTNIPNIEDLMETTETNEKVEIKNELMETTPSEINTKVEIENVGTEQNNTLNIINKMEITPPEINIKKGQSNTSETTEKAPIIRLKIRSISSINAIVHSAKSREESIFGGTKQKKILSKLVKIGPLPPLLPKNTIKIFDPKNGRIVPPEQNPIFQPEERAPQQSAGFLANTHKCNLCSRIFHTQAGFRVHANWHERLDRVVPGVEYSCQYCDHPPYKNYGAFRSHTDKHTVHFKRQQKLKKMLQETGVNISMGPVCGVCKKCFTDFRELNRHRVVAKHEIYKLQGTKSNVDCLSSL